MITHETQNTMISTLFMIGCVLLYFFYPVGDTKFEIFSAIIVFLVVLPILYHKIIIRTDVRSFGVADFSIGRRSLFLLSSAVVVGSLIGFLWIAMAFSVENYISSLSVAILQNFKAFAIYELVFASTGLFLFSFFAFGMVRSITWYKEIYAAVISFMIFSVLIVDFYSGFFMAIPVLMPPLFVIKERINPLYVFVACYIIALVIDTLIVKSFAV